MTEWPAGSQSSRADRAAAGAKLREGTPPATLDSRLVFTPERDGLYRLVVTSFKPGDTGKYTLRVHEVNKTGPAQTIKGTLQKTDNVAANEKYAPHCLHGYASATASKISAMLL